LSTIVGDAPVKATLEARDKTMSRTYPLDRVRNIGIIAHIDAGKTTVTERILYYTGRTYKIGGVDEGTAVMDWMQQERERGITITSAATTCHWLDHRINIIDTPGHVDFTAEVERSLRVLDGGMVILDAVAGVEAQSEAVWRQADKYHVARVCFINKMDRTGADFYRTVNMVERRLRAKPLPIQLPLGKESTFEGVIDLIENRALSFPSETDLSAVEVEIPEARKAEVSKHRQTLLEELAHHNDEVMLFYLEEKDIPPSLLKSVIRKLTISNQVVPVLCGSALRGKGVQPLLDAIVNYLPSPMDVPPVQGIDMASGQEIFCPARDEEPLSALAFKVVTDPFMGRLTYLRIYSGRAREGTRVLNATKGKKERLGRLYLMHANRREETEEIDAGSIVATVGLRNTTTGDTICAPSRPVLLETIHFAEPVLAMAIEPRRKADEEKLDDVLAKLSQEDPSFRVHSDPETGQNVISGMGELHLEVLVDRMWREYGVQVKMGRPRVAYKETITEPVDAEGRFVRQSGGKGQYGHVLLKLEPNERGSGFRFYDQIRSGAVPKEFVPAVEAGVRDALETGGRAGYPVVDVKATLYDGSYHEVDSSELAFKIAGSIAVKNALDRAKTVVLEPVMKVEILCPPEFLGEIAGDLSSRRAHIESMDTQDETTIIRALVPLAEMFGFATDLRSLSQGRATHGMEFHRYEELPPNLIEHIGVGTKVAR
jgi:elongation factor G